MANENQKEVAEIRRILEEDYGILLKDQLEELSDAYSVNNTVIQGIVKICKFWVEKATDIQLSELVAEKVIDFSRNGTAVISNVPETRSNIFPDETSPSVVVTTIVKTDGTTLISERFGAPLKPM